MHSSMFAMLHVSHPIVPFTGATILFPFGSFASFRALTIGYKNVLGGYNCPKPSPLVRRTSLKVSGLCRSNFKAPYEC